MLISRNTAVHKTGSCLHQQQHAPTKPQSLSILEIREFPETELRIRN